MANTYTLIESKTLGSNTASVEFTSIPQTYTDLLLKTSVRTSNNNFDSIMIRPNSSSTNLSTKWIQGVFTPSGSVVSESYSFILLRANGNDSTANTFSNGEAYFPNYAGSNYKSMNLDSVTESNGGNTLMVLAAGLWSNTSAITSLYMVTESGGNFLTNSTFYLYGISNS